jgi:hypothetical protein
LSKPVVPAKAGTRFAAGFPLEFTLGLGKEGAERGNERKKL